MTQPPSAAQRRPQLLVIFGPPAAGKMTVGEEVVKRTEFRLFHNHMSLDPVAAVFGWGSPPFGRLVDEIRRRFMEEAADSGLCLLFTYVWAFDDPGDATLIESYKAIFESRGGEVSFVELQAELETRMARNGSEHRAREKRRSAESQTPEWIAAVDAKHQLDSNGQFPFRGRYLRIDNSTVEPDVVAEQIVSFFGFSRAT